MEQLIKIQHDLKAPKNQKNLFGKYNYRSCEDILEGLKPLLLEQKCYVTLSDEITMIGDRIYVKAIATITNLNESTNPLNNGNESISVSAFAREPLSQKGMNEAQITGSASSYARKYALNGLFMIDDTKDADSQDNTQQSLKQEQQNNSQDITWLTQDNFQSAMSCGNATKIQATIKAYSTPDKKMKKEYKVALENQIKTLGN